MLALQSLQSLVWAPGAGAVLAVVQAQDQRGAQYTLAYELDVARLQGRWEISAIQMDPDAVAMRPGPTRPSVPSHPTTALHHAKESRCPREPRRSLTLPRAGRACCSASRSLLRLLGLAPIAARAAVGSPSCPARGPDRAAAVQARAAAAEGSTLEAAASKAGHTGRKVAMSLIGLAFAVAGIVLAFRRDFKEAAGVFAVGIVAVLLATPRASSC